MALSYSIYTALAGAYASDHWPVRYIPPAFIVYGAESRRRTPSKKSRLRRRGWRI